MLERLGDRAGAVAAYQAFEQRLATELETEPAAETRALIERIRAQAPAAAVSLPAASDAVADAPPDALRGWVIERELGHGGMATVYLARDTAHDRRVALKVMRPELVLSAGAEHFLREIQITAQLAHPHILPLLDSGARAGVPYLVTPYVPGESLRARLVRKGKLPVRDALRLATEIAEALDYAHRSGFVHRDVKPENVLLADGHAVIADFGVARALAVAGALPAPDIAGEEQVVGSDPYMSPEQAARSADVDARADLYSLGCLLFEMLSGEAPVRTMPVEARLAKLRDVPAPVRRLVGECMSHVREQRPASAAHLLRRLEELMGNGGSTPRVAPRRMMWMAAASIVLLVAAALGVAGIPQLRDQWQSVELGATRQLTNAPGMELDPAISPDGKFIAYAAGTVERMRISVRPAAGGDAVEISGASIRHHRWPTWSPDGSEVAFLAVEGDRGDVNGRIFVVPALGGARRLIAEGLSFFATPVWSPDGRMIAYPAGDSIVIRDAQGGASRTLPARPRAGTSSALASSSSAWAIHSLAWSPDGRRFAFVSGNAAFAFGSTAFGNLGPNSIWTVSLEGEPPTRITTGAFTYASPVFTPDGRGILYTSNAGGSWDVYHHALDGDGRPHGDARRLTTGMNAQGISLSRDGSRLAYSLLASRSNIFAAPIRPGHATPATSMRAVTDENQTIETVDVTTDGEWLVFESDRGGRSHLYKMPVTGGDFIQLTDGAGDDFAPKWSPDGSRIAYHRREPTKDGLRDVYVMTAEGAQRTRISTGMLDDSYPNWSSDGRRVTFSENPTGFMMSELRADGGWTAPQRDSARGKWTRDGRNLIWVQRGNLMAYSTGGKPRVLATGKQLGGVLTTTALGPDPSVVYARLIDSAGVHSFYAVPVKGGPPRLVLRLEDSARRPARIIFSTDNRELYFTVTEAESDLWVVTLKR
jgi:serine/threonine-protein kinase